MKKKNKKEGKSKHTFDGNQKRQKTVLRGGHFVLFKRFFLVFVGVDILVGKILHGESKSLAL
jgi:hypothetical protein